MEINAKKYKFYLLEPHPSSTMSSLSSSSSFPSSSKKAKTAATTSTALLCATSSSTLEEEVLRLRKENKGLRKEVKGLRDENAQLRAAQAESQQRLISRETWPEIQEWNAGEGYYNDRDHYYPSEIITALKREYQVPYNDNDAKALLRLKGFNPDAVRAVAEMRDGPYFPIEYFSVKGDLLMCQWLHANGAAEDISRANNEDWTPMWGACFKGHLSVCKWLFEVGADGDISTANNNGDTPMLQACFNGHLSVCKWLFEVGADGDLSLIHI